MVSITDVQAFYNNFPLAIKSLEKCSYDSANNVYLVTNQEKCFDFDAIKQIFMGNDINSVDSLYFSEAKNKIFFIEFKNSSFNNTKVNAVQSAKQSLLLHHSLMRYVDSYDYATDNNIKLVFILVLSSVKNANLIMAARMRKNSNITTNNKYNNFCQKLVDVPIVFPKYKMYDETYIALEHELINIIK